MLDIPIGTYKSRLNRPTSAMRAALEADDRKRSAPPGVAGMSAQDTFNAQLSAWLDVEAQAPVPASALGRVLKATSVRRPRPSVVAGVASHWIKAVPVNPMPPAFRLRLTSTRLVLLALVALLAVALAGAAILVGGRAEQRPAPQVRQTWPGPVHNAAGMQVQPMAPDAALGDLAWADGRDAPVDWIDITQVRAFPKASRFGSSSSQLSRPKRMGSTPQTP